MLACAPLRFSIMWLLSDAFVVPGNSSGISSRYLQDGDPVVLIAPLPTTTTEPKQESVGGGYHIRRAENKMLHTVLCTGKTLN